MALLSRGLLHELGAHTPQILHIQLMRSVLPIVGTLLMEQFYHSRQ